MVCIHFVVVYDTKICFIRTHECCVAQLYHQPLPIQKTNEPMVTRREYHLLWIEQAVLGVHGQIGKQFHQIWRGEWCSDSFQLEANCGKQRLNVKNGDVLFWLLPVRLFRRTRLLQIFTGCIVPVSNRYSASISVIILSRVPYATWPVGRPTFLVWPVFFAVCSGNWQHSQHLLKY